jgi:hypothetical protein
VGGAARRGRGGVGKNSHEVRDRGMGGGGMPKFWGRFRFQNTHFLPPSRALPPSPSEQAHLTHGMQTHPTDMVFFFKIEGIFAWLGRLSSDTQFWHGNSCLTLLISTF